MRYRYLNPLVYLTLARKIPPNEKKSGIIFTDVLSHSASTRYCLFGRVNSALPQKSVPSPILISRLIKPTNRLANERKISGKVLAKGDSWACS